MERQYLSEEQIQHRKNNGKIIVLFSILILAIFMFVAIASGMESASTSDLQGVATFVAIFCLIFGIMAYRSVISTIEKDARNRRMTNSDNKFKRSYADNQKNIFGRNSLNNSQGNSFNRSFSTNQSSVFGQDSLNSPLGNNFSRSFSKNQGSIFSGDPLKHADLSSKVCKKCYNALDKNGVCPKCSFK